MRLDTSSSRSNKRATRSSKGVTVNLAQEEHKEILDRLRVIEFLVERTRESLGLESITEDKLAHELFNRLKVINDADQDHTAEDLDVSLEEVNNWITQSLYNWTQDKLEKAGKMLNAYTLGINEGPAGINMRPRLEPGFLKRQIDEVVNRKEKTDVDRCKTCGRASPLHWEKSHWRNSEGITDASVTANWEHPVDQESIADSRGKEHWSNLPDLGPMTDSRKKRSFCGLPYEENKAHVGIGSKGAEINLGVAHTFRPETRDVTWSECTTCNGLKTEDGETPCDNCGAVGKVMTVKIDPARRTQVDTIAHIDNNEVVETEPLE